MCWRLSSLTVFLLDNYCEWLWAFSLISARWHNKDKAGCKVFTVLPMGKSGANPEVQAYFSVLSNSDKICFDKELISFWTLFY